MRYLCEDSSTVVLFVEDDRPNVIERSEQRRARANHDQRFARCRALPVAVAFAFRKRGMQHDRAVAETVVKSTGDLTRERDLRDKHDHGPTAGQHLSGRP